MIKAKKKSAKRCRCSECGGFRVAVDIVGHTTSAWLWVPHTAGLLTSWLAERLRTVLGLRGALLIEARPQHPRARSRLLCPSDPLVILHQNDTLLINVVENLSIGELDSIAAAVMHLPSEPTRVETNILSPTPMHLDEYYVQTNTDYEHHEYHEPTKERENVELNQNQSIQVYECDQPIEEYQHPDKSQDKIVEQCQHGEISDDDLISAISEETDVIKDNENISNVLHKYQHEEEKISPEHSSYAEAFKAVHKFYRCDKTKEIYNETKKNYIKSKKTNLVDTSCDNELVQPTENSNDIHCVKENMPVESGSEEQTELNVKDNKCDELSQKREAALKLLEKKLSTFLELKNHSSDQVEQVERRRRRRVRRRRRPAPYTQEPESHTTPSKNLKQSITFNRTQTVPNSEHTEPCVSPPVFEEGATWEWAAKIQKLSLSPASNTVHDTSISTPTVSKVHTHGSRREKPDLLASDVCDNTASLPAVSEVQGNCEPRREKQEFTAISELRDKRERGSNGKSARAISEMRSAPASPPPVSIVRTSPAVPPKGRLVRAIL